MPAANTAHYGQKSSYYRTAQRYAILKWATA